LINGQGKPNERCFDFRLAWGVESSVVDSTSVTKNKQKKKKKKKKKGKKNRELMMVFQFN
jgi:hypothetical protein